MKSIFRTEKLHMWKKLLLYSLIFGGIWLFVKNLTEIRDILIVVGQSEWQWVFLGILCQLGYFLGYAFLYQNTFTHVGVETDWLHIFPLTFVTLFVTLLAPFGGAGLAMYVDDATQHGKSGFKTAMGVLLGTFVFLLTFSSVLAVGLFMLYRGNALQVHEVVASSVVFLIVIGSIIILWLGARHPIALRRIFEAVFHLYNGIVKHIRAKWMLKPQWVTDKEQTVNLLGTKVIENPASLVPEILIAFLLHMLHMISLLCVTIALQQELTIGMLITAYAITMLLVMISVVPQGVGLVEGVLTVLLTSFGISLEAALAIMVIYRTISFGVPAVIGFFLLRQLKTFETTT